MESIIHMNNESPRIYNLFPRLIGSMDDWSGHLNRIKDMGFNWIYLNPFHYSGFSGSLYSIKDYYNFNPLFINPDSKLSPVEQLGKFIQTCRKKDIKVMMDLVINHTAKDHPFTKEHPEWYQKNKNGEILSPGAWDNGRWVEWGDLAEVDNNNALERVKLWNYWRDLISYYIELGFDGFRADAAYSVPSALWDFLIHDAKGKKNDLFFFAESLGCPVEKTVELAETGFDYIFNSSKWWNYQDDWLLEQYAKTREKAPSISFPESHDTPRLAFESGNNIDLIKQRTVFTAFFSSGWMIPAGFEYGFKNKMDVVHTSPSDWEEINIDLTGFIKQINQFRMKYKIFSGESEIKKIDPGNNMDILALLKFSGNGKEKALIILNRDLNRSYNISAAEIGGFPEVNNIKEYCLFPEEKPSPASFKDLNIELKPYDIKVFYLAYK